MNPHSMGSIALKIFTRDQNERMLNLREKGNACSNSPATTNTSSSSFPERRLGMSKRGSSRKKE